MSDPVKPSKRTVTLFIALCLAVSGCDDDPCVALRAVVTDIDETLTTSNGEWVFQTLYPDHDPATRPDADTLMRGYADLGYAVFYVTARGEDLTLVDGTPARQATEDWLELHGFPLAEGRLFLAEGLYVDGDDAVEYKRDVLLSLQAEGWTLDWAYGNADTDIEAFLQAEIPRDRIFLVGSLAGTMDVQPLPDEEAFTRHVADHLPAVPPAPCE